MTGMILTPETNVPAYGNLKETIEACEKIGQALAVAYNLASPHHGTIMMLTCTSENLSVSNYHKRYHSDGAMRASAIQAEFIRRGGLIAWVDLGDEGKTASANFSHPILMPTARLISYSIDDARRQVGPKMDKDGSNWKTNPGAMLRAALIRKAVKIIDPGVIGGYDDFNDLDSSPINSPQTTVVDQSAVESRRKELLATANTPVTTVVDSAPAETVVVPEEEIIDAVIEPKIDEKPAATNEVRPCTSEQLQELAALGSKFPSATVAGSNMSIQEVMAGINTAASVKKPSEMTFDQASELITRWRGELAKL